MQKHLIILMLALFVGCSVEDLQTGYKTGYFKGKIVNNSAVDIIYIGEKEKLGYNTILPGVNAVAIGINPIGVEIANNSFLTRPNYEKLNISELIYRGDKVTWVYQFEKKIDEFSMQIVPCIIIENGTRFCDYEQSETE